MKILIRITEKVLEATKTCGIGILEYVPKHCAITYAVREIFPNAVVGLDIYVSDDFNTRRIPIPPVATKFIGDFDTKTPKERVLMQPFSFEIDVPSEVIDQIGIGECYKILSESKTLELVSI